MVTFLGKRVSYFGDLLGEFVVPRSVYVFACLTHGFRLVIIRPTPNSFTFFVFRPFRFPDFGLMGFFFPLVYVSVMCQLITSYVFANIKSCCSRIIQLGIKYF